MVHEAAETTKWRAGSKVSSFTPTTKVASASLPGAEMITRLAPRLDVAGGGLAAGETSRRLDDDLDASLAPGDGLGVPFLEDR